MKTEITHAAPRRRRARPCRPPRSTRPTGRTRLPSCRSAFARPPGASSRRWYSY